MTNYAKLQTAKIRRKAFLRAAKARATEKYTYHGDPNPKRKPVTLATVSIQKCVPYKR